MYTVDPQAFLQPYYESIGISPDKLTGSSFDLIVTSWLNQVLSTKHPHDLPKHQDWLVSSGLFDKLAGGHLELDAAA